MNNKRLAAILLISLAAAYSAAAASVGVIVSFPDGAVHGQCLNVKEGTNGYDVLQKLSLETLWAGPGSYGHMLCKMNGVGDDIIGKSCSYAGKFWIFFEGKGNEWQGMPVGFDGGDGCWNRDQNSFSGHYCAKHGDLIGLRYGEFGDVPDYYSFEDVCIPLNIKEVKVYVDGKKQSSADDEGGRIKAKPDSTILFKMGVENNYLFDDELKVNDIEAQITLEDIDDGEDIEKYITFSELEVGEDGRDELEFDIPLFVEDGKYDLELKVTGETSTGIEQEIIVEYTLNVKKEMHDTFISRAELQSLESCQDETNRLFVEVTNLGRTDEKDILLSVRNEDFGLSFFDRFNLDAGDDKEAAVYKKGIGFAVPVSANPGEHVISITIDYGERINEEVTLIVNECNRGVISETDKALLQPADGNQDTVPKPQVKKAIPIRQVYYEKTFIEEYTVPILLGAFLFALVAMILFIVAMLGK